MPPMPPMPPDAGSAYGAGPQTTLAGAPPPNKGMFRGQRRAEGLKLQLGRAVWMGWGRAVRVQLVRGEGRGVSS